MSLLRKKTVVAAKLESTLGTAESLAASDAAFNAYDLSITPNIENHQRSAQGTMSKLASIMGARSVEVTFKQEIHGSGTTDTDPTWAGIFLPAVGLVGSSHVFSLSSKVPVASSGNPRTITIGCYMDGIALIIAGCMGNAKIIIENGQVAYVEYTFMGKYSSVSDVALPTPTLPSVTPPRSSNLTFTLAGSTPGRTNRIEIDLGNVVTMREDISDGGGSAGYAYAIITDRDPKMTIPLEAQLVATNDVFGKWLAGTQEAFALTLDGGTWNQIDLAAPKAQIVNITKGDREGLWTDELEIEFKRSAANDDEFTLTFAA